VTPEDVQRLMAGNPSLKRLTVEVVVIEQTRPSGDAPWSKARKIHHVTLWDGAIKFERTVTEKGDHMAATCAGTPEVHNLATIHDIEPQGRPS